MNELQIISSNSFIISLKCVAISDEIFGKKFHNLDFFRAENKIKLFALKNKTLIGFLIAKKIMINLIEIESIGIKVNFQNQSVGTMLMNKFYYNYVDQTTNIYTKAWKSKNIIYVDKLIKKFGLKAVKNNGRIWKDECNITFHCKHFKNKCECESILYIK